jgi:hypothetical protein
MALSIKGRPVKDSGWTANSRSLSRVVGRYALQADVLLSVTQENGHLFIQENDEPKQKLLAVRAQDFHSRSSGDEYTFKLAEGAAQVLVLRLDGKNLEFKRVQ